MSISDGVRKALKSAKKTQTELGNAWGTTPQVINNKIRQGRWTGEELAQVAALTGGWLAFIYPNGDKILLEASDVAGKRPAKRKMEKAPAAPAKTAAPKAAAKPKKAKAPAAPKKRKTPEQEEQISLFDL